MNYPLARSARTKSRWQKDKDGWWCLLPGDERIELSLPSDANPSLRRCPTGFDMNVLFRIFVAVQVAQPQRVERIDFASEAALLRELHLTAHDENRLHLRRSLHFWSKITIHFSKWYEEGRHSIVEFGPPIERTEYRGNRIVLTLNRRWVKLAAAKGYYAPLPFPLPTEAAAQNAILMLLTSKPEAAEENFRATYERGRQWFYRKIGLRCETKKLRRIAELMNDWLDERGGSVIIFDGHRADPGWDVRPGKVKFMFFWPKIPRKLPVEKQTVNGARRLQTRRSTGLKSPKNRRSTGA